MPMLQSVTLSCLALGASGLKADVQSHIIDEVVPELFIQMKKKNIDTAKMNRLHIVPWDDDKEKIVVLGYPKEEDKEVSGALANDGHWETRHTKDLCKPWSKDHRRGVFLDVGANIGTYSLPMSACVKHSGNGTVISIEGMPTIAEHFRAGIVANNADNIQFYPYAVGGRVPQNNVTMLLDPENKGGSSVAGNKAGDESLRKAGVQSVQVPLTTLDSMFAVNPRLTAVLSAKVDIEGNEGRFFQGAHRFFSGHPPCYLMVELIPEWLESAGTPVEEVLTQLTNWGYEGVPTAENLRARKWGGKTIHLEQKDMQECFERVGTNFAQFDLQV